MPRPRASINKSTAPTSPVSSSQNHQDVPTIVANNNPAPTQLSGSFYGQWQTTPRKRLVLAPPSLTDYSLDVHLPIPRWCPFETYHCCTYIVTNILTLVLVLYYGAFVPTVESRWQPAAAFVFGSLHIATITSIFLATTLNPADPNVRLSPANRSALTMQYNHTTSTCSTVGPR